MTDTDPLFEFGSPDPDSTLEEGVKLRGLGFLNVEEVARWLVRKGVLSFADRTKPADEWPIPYTHETGFKVQPVYWKNLRQRCMTGEPSFTMGIRIIKHVEEACAALRRDGSLSDVFGPLARAQDGALAAWRAGYHHYPLSLVLDGLTGLMAMIAGMLRDEVMARILAGSVSAEEGEAALAVLKDGWTPEVADNAERFAEKLKALEPYGREH